MSKYPYDILEHLCPKCNTKTKRYYTNKEEKDHKSSYIKPFCTKCMVFLNIGNESRSTETLPLLPINENWDNKTREIIEYIVKQNKIKEILK